VPVFSDFASAIWMVCGISLTALFANKALAKDAGAQLSGHRQA
jgi:hypothetical protein